MKSRPIVHPGGYWEKLTIAIAMAVELKERMVQTRVLTNCPLCGFRQRLERLTGGEYHVTDPGDLLPLEVAAVFAGKGRGTLHTELLPLKVTPEQRQEMLEALAAKMLPLVQYLSVQVPEFGEALLVPELTVTVERDVQVSGLELPVPREKGVQVSGLELPVPREKEVLPWRSVPVSRTVRRSKSVPGEMSVPTEMDVLVEMNVPMDGT